MSDDAFREVKQVMENYVKSVETLDFELMRSLAHEDGRIYIGNTSTSKNLHDHWKGDEERFKTMDIDEWKKKLSVKILSIQVEGTIANVKIRMGNWYDFHNLVKTPEGWKLVTKVSHKIE